MIELLTTDYFSGSGVLGMRTPPRYGNQRLDDTRQTGSRLPIRAGLEPHPFGARGRVLGANSVY
ncbi:hypothetical protein [Mycolicibacterium hodleri]|uniref:Uncharacterized protein n=1 Tax=Mycolicibacterium hodleri TaxID=49897 RepID=A0A502DXU7_9MYCO|nr:hypothetical protein [Mycolicibacterium hodleri]TPG29509.1 hypothetical protein EAH80_27125 [Mycolicibacterium hodleri]